VEAIMTKRLVLRPFELSDLDDLASLHAEPSFWHYPLRRPQSERETESFLESVIDRYGATEIGLWAVIEAETGLLAGWAGLAVPRFLPEVLPAIEVGWRLGKAFWNKGYATEAGAVWVSYGFERLGLERIVSIYEPENSASGRVMEKLGFSLERTTLEPGRQLELRVTELDRATWQALVARGNWPDSP
jgi:RimJ/RimL family protein N-acetyltransferase